MNLLHHSPELWYNTQSMDIDPHTIHLILRKIQQQLSCPQCTKKVNVQIESLKVVGDAFVVFQLQCPVCGAYVVLHATITSIQGKVPTEVPKTDSRHNISTSLNLSTEEIDVLRECLKKSNGSFAKMFSDAS